ncbi:hypothetical protein [Azorhizobium doebereinerae]|uniref:hypothetical protein n=1 Tax=Azorhizobium doebereinerae TaxID=281091 RepID=UPI00048C3404|nr:hypothetical protein [Azorhizobium doebereinerae]
MKATGRVLPSIISAEIVRLPSPGRRPKVTDLQIKEAFLAGRSDEQMAKAFGISTGYVRIKRLSLNLKRPTGRRAGGVEPIRKADRPALSRFEPKVATTERAVMPPVDHAALSEARSVYPTTVVSPRGLPNLLVSGKNHWKIGERIMKGPWSGFPVFTLTLEERATCPSSCRHWRSCYGNHMHHANRVEHGADMEERLAAEVAVLSFRYPAGFAVRLHVLGDFYSVGYVKLWAALLDRHSELHVFGFSARWQVEKDPIAAALVALVKKRWARFAIRFSNAPIDECSTITVEHPLQVPDDAILCPQQVGKTDSCSTCALCWSSTKRISFLQH